MKKIFFFYFFISVSLCIGLKNYSAFFFSQTPVKITISSSISDQYKTSIISFLSDMQQNNRVGDQCINGLKKQFPFLNTISIEYKPNCMHMRASIDTPIGYINDNFILTEKGKLFEKAVFTELIEDHLIHISMDEIAPVSGMHLVSFIQCMPENFHTKYKIKYENDHSIFFIDNYDKKYTIVSCNEKKDYVHRFTQCDRVKEYIEHGKSQDMQWIIDVRFQDYIIAYKSRGEYGTI